MALRHDELRNDFDTRSFQFHLQTLPCLCEDSDGVCINVGIQVGLASQHHAEAALIRPNAYPNVTEGHENLLMILENHNTMAELNLTYLVASNRAVALGHCYSYLISINYLRH